MPLPFAVVLDQVGIGSAALLLVVRMPGTPLLLALQHNLVILQVIRNFLAVIIGATSMLALRLTADFLLRTIQGRQKRSLAVRTTARLAQTGSSVDCEMNLRGKDKLAKQSTQFRNCCRVLTAPRRQGLSLDISAVVLWLRPRPAKMAPFSTGVDTVGSPHCREQS